MRIELPLNNHEHHHDDSQKPQGDYINLFLTGMIETESITELSRVMLEIDTKNRLTGTMVPIQLFINTPGGDLYATWQMCDIMSTIMTPIQTVGLGQVASGGFIIFMNGTPGRRIATVNTQFMTHRYAMAFEATHANIVSQRPELDRIHSRIISHYKKCTGLSVKNIEKHLLTEHDVWLTAEECKELGVCDIIIDTNARACKPRRKKNNKVA
jgi:ATP-dependent Clp protease protease subunit